MKTVTTRWGVWVLVALASVAVAVASMGACDSETGDDGVLVQGRVQGVRGRFHGPGKPKACPSPEQRLQGGLEVASEFSVVWGGLQVRPPVDARRVALTPALRNAIGTEIFERQVAEDRGEAQGGSWKRALWFAAPLWGAVMIDAWVKGVRAG